MILDNVYQLARVLGFTDWKLQYSMIRQESAQQKQWQQQNILSYQSKKLLHMIELQILDIESTLHYIQKKHTMHQLKEALSQIYNIFNQMEPLFRTIRGLFLHQEVKKIMNCFGIIYVVLMDHLEKGNRGAENEILQLENIKKESKEQVCEASKTSNTLIDPLNGQLKSTSKPLGGIFLYNQQYSRHLQNQEPFRKVRNGKLQTVLKEPSRQELNRMVVDEINDTSHLSTPSEQPMDIFSFKFKYGKESQVVTFHDELLSIANFFKQSQNQAFEFLNKTKDQTSIITYNDSFKDVMNQIKKEKQQKLKIFNDKIKSAFGSIKSKTEKKMVEMQNKIMCMQETQHKKEVNKHEKQVQTIFNVDEQLKSLRRRLADSQEKYRIMIQIKKKELEENTMIGLELQSQISIKNREIVYLKLNVQESSLMISNLNKRVKFLTQSNRKIKDIVKNTDQPNKLLDAVDNKEDADKFLKEEADDEIALEALRKQRKMAKKMLLDKRKSSLLGGEKASYMKRFTQQMDSAKMTPNHLLSRNLSQINEDGSQAYDEDSYSIASNKNNMLTQELARPYPRRKTKKVSIIPDSRGQGSSHSIKSRQSLTTKSKKVIKQKRASQAVDVSNRTSFMSKIKDTPHSINEDSILDQCSDQEKEYLDGGNGEKLSINAEDYNKIEEMFKKQMNRTKNIINNNKRFSSFNVGNNKNTTKSFFSSQKQNSQESVASPQGNSKTVSRSKSSFRNSRQEEDNRSIHRLSKKMDNQQSHSPPQYGNSLEVKVTPAARKDSIRQPEPPRRLNLYSSQFNIAIYEPVQKAESFIQTQQKKVAEPNQDSSSPQIKPIVFSNNTIHISNTKDAIFQRENTASSQLITRSATQSKMIKNRHLKTLYSVASKENQKYFIPKHTQKSIDQQFKNSHSCLEMQENVHKELQEIVAQKRDTAYEQAQRVRQDRQIRKLAIKCRTLQEFKARVAEMHKLKCGHTCKHLQKFVQNYIKYKQESKPKIKMPIKNLCDNIAFTTADQQQRNYFPMLQKKRN